MKFISPQNDPWTPAPEEQPVAHVAHQLLSWQQWLDVHQAWPQGLPVGVVFANDANVKDLVPHLPRLALVALRFPKWTDGRAYSQARLLRVRHRYGGEVRAIGDVIPDMAAQLHRTGFDSVVLRAGESAEVAARMLDFFGEFYQGDVHERAQRFARPGVGVAR